MRDEVPRCDNIRSVTLPDYFLSHAIWRNGFGSYQPETGVRKIIRGAVQKEFRLIQHGVGNFDFAEPLIVCGLRKGWDAERIGEFVFWLAQRRRVKANVL